MPSPSAAAPCECRRGARRSPWRGARRGGGARRRPSVSRAPLGRARASHAAVLPRLARLRTASTAGSCSTATSSSAGSRSEACRRSRAGTSTGRSTSTAGRRSCRARRTRPRSSAISVPSAPRSSPASTRRSSSRRPPDRLRGGAPDREGRRLVQRRVGPTLRPPAGAGGQRSCNGPVTGDAGETGDIVGLVEIATEYELKLEAPEGFELPDLGGSPLEPRVFTSVYYDTADGSLMRAGITLRRRTERGRSVWQLKLPAADARLELEQPGGPAEPPGELGRLLATHLRRGPVAPVAELRTRRHGALVARNGTTAEVTIDEVAVMDALRVTGEFVEIEIELRSGERKGLDEIAGEVAGAGATAVERRAEALPRARHRKQPRAPPARSLRRAVRAPAPPAPRDSRARSRDPSRHGSREPARHACRRSPLARAAAGRRSADRHRHRGARRSSCAGSARCSAPSATSTSCSSGCTARRPRSTAPTARPGTACCARSSESARGRAARC